MEIKRPKVTDELIIKVNKWCQTKLTKSIIPKCFGDPLLRSGLCNPQYPVPKDPTPEVPKPLLCGCYHICLIYLAEFLGVDKPDDIQYEKLVKMCIEKINAADATETQAENKPPESIQTTQEASETPQASSEETTPAQPLNMAGAETGRTQSSEPNQANEPKQASAVQPKEGSTKVPYRRNSKPYILWAYLTEGAFRSRDEMEKHMIENGNGQLHYIDKVIAKATELNALEKEGGSVRIV